jgi:hypothetical protein
VNVDDVEQLLAKQDITEVLHRYGYALDGRDWGLLRTCFTDDVVGEYGGDPLHGYEAVEHLCRSTLEPLSVSQHLIGNVSAAVTGDRAEASCYLHAQHVRPGTEGGEQFVFAGRYVDRLVRTSDGWRIAFRRLQPMWTSGNPAVIGRPLKTLADG